LVVRERIAKKIEWLAENLDQIMPQQLTGNLAGYYKLRVGDYRVIYDFISEEKVLIIYKIGQRNLWLISGRSPIDRKEAISLNC